MTYTSLQSQPFPSRNYRELVWNLVFAFFSIKINSSSTISRPKISRTATSLWTLILSTPLYIEGAKGSQFLREGVTGCKRNEMYLQAPCEDCVGYISRRPRLLWQRRKLQLEFESTNGPHISQRHGDMEPLHIKTN